MYFLPPYSVSDIRRSLASWLVLAFVVVLPFQSLMANDEKPGHETKPVAKPETKPDAKPEPKAEDHAKPEPAPVINRPRTSVEVKPAAEAEHKSAPEPAKAKAKAEPKHEELEQKSAAKEPAKHEEEESVEKTEVKSGKMKLSEPLAESDNLLPAQLKGGSEMSEFERTLEAGRELRKRKIWNEAEKILGNLIQAPSPMDIKRDALLELGLIAEESQQITKAQQVYAQFIRTFPEDPAVPEVYLRQGLIYRAMGAPNMALGKFYAVMSAALNLKADHLEHYQRLVLRAQTEIADTYYLRGSYSDAAEFFDRLMKLDDPALNKPQIACKLVRTLSALQRYDATVAKANFYLQNYIESADAAEVRFLLADSLRKLGRNREATAQVMILLQSQQANAEQKPEVWRYWQQRTGNEIGNQLYRDGDYLNSLEIYNRLTELDEAPDWRAPLYYQIGLAFEKLEQPQRAVEAYRNVLECEKKIGAKATPAQKLVFDMARWRLDQSKWTSKVTEKAVNITATGTNSTVIAHTP